jgi:NDP-sugar pyrophosphorylase family protein
MQALIFAAGKGTRLNELTENTPKPLLKIYGNTLLAHTILKLKNIGVNHIVINVHYLKEQIIDYLNANDFGVKISISDEGEKLLDTGGGLLYAQKHFDLNQNIILHNSDIISDIDLGEMINFHNDFSPLSTLAVRKRETTRKLIFDQRMQLSGRKNFKTNEEQITRPLCCKSFELGFSGIHIVSPSIFKLLDKYARKNGEKFSITDFYLSASTKENIIGYTHNYGSWADIGKYDEVKHLIEK